MKTKIGTTIPLFICSLLLALFVVIVPASAEEHAGEEVDHDHDTMVEVTSHSDASQISAMQQLITLLQQLIAALQEQVELEEGHVHDDSHEHAEELSISVEIHGDRTHVHVNENGVETASFFLDDLAITDEEAIIAAIATETGLDEHAVEAAAMFPSSEAMDDDHDEHADEEEVDLDGIHIMSDGTVMLGSGEELPTASVTDDGMIMLEDGTTVEPAFDLR